MSIRITNGKPQHFTVEQVRQFLSAAKGRVRLYLLLSLNCGYYQGDISDLRPDQVDWDRGHIRRKRSKTSGYESVREVDYPLWTETFNLLQRYRSSDPDHVLTTSHGTPLVRRRLNKSGNASGTDSVRLAWRWFCRQQGYDPLPQMKVMRKTAANLLEQHPTYGRCSIHFLGHSPRGVAAKHYLDVPQDLFDEAVRWLGSQFGM